MADDVTVRPDAISEKGATYLLLLSVVVEVVFLGKGGGRKVGDYNCELYV